MAAKKMRTRTSVKGPSSLHKTHAPAKKGEKKLQIKSVDMKDLAQRIQGKDGVVEVLAFSSEDVIGHVTRIVSTGSVAVDRATGLGGFPFARIVEVSGKEQAGKTTLVAQVVANVQKMGGHAILVDSENKWDRIYTAALGVDLTKLQVIQTKREDADAVKTVQLAISAIYKTLRYWIENSLQHIPLVIVWDSVAGSPTKEEYEDPDNKQPSVAARELRRAMRTLGDLIAKASALFLIVNQKYAIIGYTGGKPGPKSTTFGGGGIRYHATLRLELIRIGTLKLPTGYVVGIEGICRVEKNSLGAERDEGYAVAYLRGFDDAHSILEKLKGSKHIHVGGGRYYFTPPDAEPVSWQGGFAELDQMMRTDAALRQKLVGIYKSLP